ELLRVDRLESALDRSFLRRSDRQGRRSGPIARGGRDFRALGLRRKRATPFRSRLSNERRKRGVQHLSPRGEIVVRDPAGQREHLFGEKSLLRLRTEDALERATRRFAGESDHVAVSLA